MKKAFFITLISILVLTLTVNHLNADKNHDYSIDDVLAEIRQELNLDNNDNINPDTVSNSLLERLGEALMDTMHPDEAEHELMENMMGRNGQETLKTMHRTMGYRFLEKNNSKHIFNTCNFYTASMMGWDRHGHMGFLRFGWIGGIIMGIFFLIITGVLIFIIYLALFKKREQVTGMNNNLDILNKRYASGEITKEEYDQIKKDILS